MGRQVHVAVPGIDRPEPTAQRNAVEPRRGHRYRLDRYRPAGGPERGDGEEGALERQRAVAVARRPFGEQDQVLARLQPLPQAVAMPVGLVRPPIDEDRSEEHTSELQSLMLISYAGFCLKKKIQ